MELHSKNKELLKKYNVFLTELETKSKKEVVMNVTMKKVI